jgi:hypothetical protein
VVYTDVANSLASLTTGSILYVILYTHKKIFLDP